MGILLIGKVGMGKVLRRRLDMELVFCMLEVCRRFSLPGSGLLLGLARPLLKLGVRPGVLLYSGGRPVWMLQVKVG